MVVVLADKWLECILSRCFANWSSERSLRRRHSNIFEYYNNWKRLYLCTWRGVSWPFCDSSANHTFHTGHNLWSGRKYTPEVDFVTESTKRDFNLFWTRTAEQIDDSSNTELVVWFRFHWGTRGESIRLPLANLKKPKERLVGCPKSLISFGLINFVVTHRQEETRTGRRARCCYHNKIPPKFIN